MIGNSSYLDYDDIIHGQPKNKIFYQKLQSFKYSTALVLARVIRGIYEKNNVS